MNKSTTAPVAMESPRPYDMGGIITSSLTRCTSSVISQTADSAEIHFISTQSLLSPWSLAATAELFCYAVSGFAKIRVYMVPTYWPSFPLDYTWDITATTKVEGSTQATNSQSQSARDDDNGIYSYDFTVPYYRFRVALNIAYGDTVGYSIGPDDSAKMRVYLSFVN